MAQSYRDLIVWQKAMDVVDTVYEVADAIPANERFALRDQLVRAVISIPANIAEGNRHGTRRDYAQFISIARGSLAEVETYILISTRRGYLNSERSEALLDSLDHLSRMLTNLRQRLLN